MRFDLADLRLFVTIVRQGSITRGAEAMNLALASASQRLSGMEAVIGTVLLERSRRGVRPTAAGALLLRHAQEILLQADRMQGELRAFATGLRGRIRLPANTGAALGFLPQALQGFLAAHPGLDIDVDERPSIEIVRLVAEGEAEFGIIADIVDAGALELYRLREDPLVLILPVAHRLADRAAIDFTEIAPEPFVGLMDAALESHMAEHAARRGVRLNHRIRLRSVAAIGRMVREGIGVAVLPESAVGDLDGCPVRALPLSNAWARRRLALCVRTAADLTPQARLLFGHIRAYSTEASAVE